MENFPIKQAFLLTQSRITEFHCSTIQYAPELSLVSPQKGRMLASLPSSPAKKVADLRKTSASSSIPLLPPPPSLSGGGSGGPETEATGDGPSERRIRGKRRKEASSSSSFSLTLTPERKQPVAALAHLLLLLLLLLPWDKAEEEGAFPTPDRAQRGKKRWWWCLLPPSPRSFLLRRDRERECGECRGGRHWGEGTGGRSHTPRSGRGFLVTSARERPWEGVRERAKSRPLRATSKNGPHRNLFLLYLV